MMTDALMNLIETWGLGAILIALFIEGSSFPFIGTYFVITVGFFIELTWGEIIITSVLGSLVYAIGSFIPYYIGLKLGESLERRLSSKKGTSLIKVKKMMNKYGKWSIAILSPLHLGNVIPFLAGMSSIKLRSYTLLVMLGIAPTTFIYLSLGKLIDADPETIMNLINEYQTAILIGFLVILLLGLGFKWIRRRRKAEKSI